MENSNVQSTPPNLITARQLSELWNVKIATIYQWVFYRRIPFVKLGGLLRFDLAALEDFRRSCTIGVAGKR